jgi:hypothetical protein
MKLCNNICQQQPRFSGQQGEMLTKVWVYVATVSYRTMFRSRLCDVWEQ